MDIVEEILKHNRLALSKGITAVENEYDNAVDIMTKIYSHTDMPMLSVLPDLPAQVNPL